MQREAFAEAIAGLPLPERAVLLMNAREEMSFDQIGRCLGISVDAVQSALARALATLAYKLESY